MAGKPRRPELDCQGPVADLEVHLTPDWWSRQFNAIYLKSDGDIVEDDENTCNDLDAMIAATGLEQQEFFLDLCCGQGRHSLELARRGYRNITGIDQSSYLIRLARKRAAAMDAVVTFRKGDSRRIRSPQIPFDCVAIMGSSFGYFETPEEDFSVLQSVKKVLRSGGRLFLDLPNGEWLKTNFEPQTWSWLDRNHLSLYERALSRDRSRLIARAIYIHKRRGVLEDHFYAVRLYSFEKLAGLLEQAGFTAVQNSGSVENRSVRGQELGIMANRLLITAQAT